MTEKNIIIIAGPNGAGKTTFAQEFLPQEANCPIFINADLIAQGLSPFRPEAAAVRSGRIMLEMIPAWRTAGYRVVIFFLELPSEELALQRVADRVAQGGHDIPEPVIRRRFTAGRENFARLYKALADEWKHFDNAGDEPILLASSSPDL